MKSIFNYFIAILILGTTFVACQEELTDPKDYEFKVDPSKTPTVATVGETKVSASYAILSGTSGIDRIDCGFLLSTSSNFETYTVHTAGEVETDGFVLKIEALAPQTTYYYKAFAANFLGGTGLGEVKSFTTREGITAFRIDALTSSVEEWENVGFDDIDLDGDGHSWSLGYYDEEAAQAWMTSASWDEAPLTPNNYLLFPEINFAGVDGVFTITVVGVNPNYPNEKFKIVVSEAAITAENAESADVLFTHTLANKDVFTKSIELPAKYEGKKVYFALVHFDCTDNDQFGFIGASFGYAK